MRRLVGRNSFVCLRVICSACKPRLAASLTSVTTATAHGEGILQNPPGLMRHMWRHFSTSGEWTLAKPWVKPPCHPWERKLDCWTVLLRQTTPMGAGAMASPPRKLLFSNSHSSWCIQKFSGNSEFLSHETWLHIIHSWTQRVLRPLLSGLGQSGCSCWLANDKSLWNGRRAATYFTGSFKDYGEKNGGNWRTLCLP